MNTRRLVPLIALACLPGIAGAQTALMKVTANGAAAVSVPLDSIVVINSTVSWTPGMQLAAVQGRIEVDGNVGVGSGFSSAFSLGPQVNLGSFNGGSRVGIDILVTPAFFTGGFMVPPSGNFSGVMIGQYSLDLTGVPGGTYHVNWIASAAMPNVRLFPNVSSPAFVEAATTYEGATITIIPSPGVVGLLSLGGIFAVRRRR